MLAPGLHADDFGVSIDFWRPDDGAPRDNVTSFAQSADGYLWIATADVVARFDGVRFSDVESDRFLDLGQQDAASRPAHDRLTGPFRVWQTPGSTVWLSSGAGGLWRWTGHDFSQWHTPDFPQEPIAKLAALENGRVMTILSSGKVFIGAEMQLKEISGETRLDASFTEILRRHGSEVIVAKSTAGTAVAWDGNGRPTTDAPDLNLIREATAEKLDPEGRLWLATADGLFRADPDGTFAPFANPAPHLSIRSIYPTTGNNCWVGAGDGYWSVERDQWRHVTGLPLINTANGVAVADQHSDLWIGTSGNGCWRSSADGRTTQFGPDEGVTADAAALFGDREGNIWVSIYRTGIARFRRRRFEAVEVTNLLHTASLWNIAEDREGGIWLSPEFKGPVRWMSGQKTEFGLPRFTGSKGWSQAVTIDRTGVACIAAASDAIYRYEDSSLKEFLPWPPHAAYCTALLQDQHEKWWMGSSFGLHSWDGSSWKDWGPADGLPEPATHALAEDDEGKLWAGLYSGGVARYDGDKFVRFGREAGLPSEAIYTIYAGDDHTLWIGTYQGLARRKNGRFKSYGLQQGLPDNHIRQIMEDGHGFLWLGTQNGLCRVALASFDAVDAGAKGTLDCLTLDRHDGLPANSFQGRGSPACCRARDGALWFLTAGGAAFCQPEEITANPIPADPQIEGVSIDGRASNPAANLLLARLCLPSLSMMDLAPGPHLLEFQFTAPNLTAPEKVRFKYRMEGLDRDWIDAGPRRTAQYSFLPPGSYRFQVMSSNNDGIWSERKSEALISIEPHLWQRNWFPWLATLCVAAAAGAGVAMYSRIRHARRLVQLELRNARESERMRISRDLHDDLGASLTEIGMLASDAGEAPHLNSEARGQFQLISEKAEGVVSALDTIVWAVDPQKDTLPALASFVGSFVEEYALAANLACRINLQSDLPKRTLSSEVRHSVFLAVKEAAHNAVKHANASLLTLQLAADGESVKIMISDDGQGLPAKLPGGGNGLSNLEHRMANLGGRCAVESKPTGGVSVTLQFPLPALPPEP